MSIIKIHLFRQFNQKQQKFLLTYIQGIHYTVKDFLISAINTLNINSSIQNLIVQHDGYIIPHCIDGAILSKSQIITIKIKKQNKLQSELGIWTANHIHVHENNKQNMEIQNQKEQQSQSESTPKFSQNGYVGVKANLDQKLKKYRNDKNIKKKKKILQQESQLQQEQQKQVIKQNKHKKQKKKEKKKKIQSPQQSQESQDQQLPRASQSKKQNKQKKKQQKQMKKHKKHKHQSQQQQKQDGQQQMKLKALQVKKFQSFGKRQSYHVQEKQLTKQKKKYLKKRVEQTQKIQKSPQIQPQQPKKVLKTIYKPQNYSQKRKIIQINDIQSSQQSSQQHNKRKHVHTISTKKPTPTTMIPPALRSKPQTTKPTSSFKSYQSQQWLIITKQILDKFNKSKKQHEINFLQKNNLIKFKQIQLDLQKFIPITSEWIQATIEDVEKDGKLKLSKVTQLGKQYREKYQICDFNMVELQMNKNYATKEQLLLITGDEKKNQVNQQQKHEENDQNIQPQAEQKKNLQDPKCSLQKFICGQVNYYFSDKNYPFDLFMQMHANKNPQKWMPIRFLLNFGKIKKVLRDENKLLQYLIGDEKKQQRNFQINQQTKMVRKKLTLQELANIQSQKEQQNNQNKKQKVSNIEQPQNE